MQIHIIHLVLWLMVFGFICYLATSVQMPPLVRNVIYFVLAIAAILFVCQVCGIDTGVKVLP